MTDPAAIDAFCIGYAGWLSPESTDPEDFNLAAVVMQAEAEWREGSWEAVAAVLDHVKHGRLVWPEDAVARATLFEAVWRLGWLGLPSAPGEGAGGPEGASGEDEVVP